GAVTTSAGSLLRVFGNSAGGGGGHAALTIASSITNLGTLDITSQTGAFVANAALTITGGTLTNAAGATVTVNAGNSGGTRALSASLDNQGTITINHPLSWTTNGSNQSAGTITVSGGDLSFTQPAGTTFSHSGSIAISSGRTLTISGGALT